MSIVLLEALKDNYVAMVQSSLDQWCVIDPSEADPVLRHLQENGGALTLILNTHHHPDHVGGNAILKRKTGAQVICSSYDCKRIATADRGVEDGATLDINGEEVEVLAIPGHTLGHIAFYFRQRQAVFVGDTLFRLGCGRLFEGTPEQMWQSLKRLARLPADTQIYCGHEYTEQNLRFALSLQPQSEPLLSEQSRVSALRAQRLPTVPGRLGEELRLNPFLRSAEPAMRAALNLPLSASALDVFTALRQRKDHF